MSAALTGLSVVGAFIIVQLAIVLAGFQSSIRDPRYREWLDRLKREQAGTI